MLVAGYYGVDLTGMLTGEPVSQQQTTTQRSISPQEEQAAKFTKVILADTKTPGAPSSKRWAVNTRSRSWYSIAARRGPAAVPASP
nr:YpfJ protein, zinc metalloprotease superfamily [Raoultella sp. NCTC 9187]